MKTREEELFSRLIENETDEKNNAFSEIISHSLSDELFDSLAQFLVKHPDILINEIVERPIIKNQGLRNIIALIEGVYELSETAFEEIRKSMPISRWNEIIDVFSIDEGYKIVDSSLLISLIGAKGICDRIGESLSNMTSTPYFPNKSMMLLNIYKVGHLTKEFPAIEYIMDTYRNIGLAWEGAINEALAFLDVASESKDISHKNVYIKLHDYKNWQRLGVFIDKHREKGSRILGHIGLIEDLSSAYFLSVTGCLDDKYAGRYTTALFISKALNGEMDKDSIRTVIEISDCLEEMLVELSAEEARKIIDLDRENPYFKTLKWKDRGVKRDMISSDLGL